MVKGEREIPTRPRKEIVDRWIETVTVLPSEEDSGAIKATARPLELRKILAKG